MSTLWGNVASTLAKAQRIGRDTDEQNRARQQQEEALAERKRMQQMQMAATLAGLQQQGIMSGDQGADLAERGVDTTGAARLGDTGFVNVPTQTPGALAKVAQGKAIQQRVVTLRRQPKLKELSDDELGALASDDSQYLKLIAEPLKTPTFKREARLVNGKPAMVRVDEQGRDVDDQGNPIVGGQPYEKPDAPRGPQNPVMGSPEWLKAQEALANLRPRAPVMGSPEWLAAQEALAKIHANNRAPAQQRSLPASAVEKIAGLDAMIGSARRVKEAIDGAIASKTDATGRAGGIIKEPGWIMNARGKGGVAGENVRTLIGNLYSTVAKERGGTALSASEIALLESYIPNKDDPEATASRKAQQFIDALEDIKKTKIAGYQKYGYGVDDDAPIGDHLEGTAPAGGGKALPAKPPLSTRIQQLKKDGLSKEAARAKLLSEGYDLKGAP